MCVGKTGVRKSGPKTRKITTKTSKGGLSPETQLLVALRYYATGNSINSLKNTADLKLSHGSKKIETVKLKRDTSASQTDPVLINYRGKGFNEFALKTEIK